MSCRRRVKQWREGRAVVAWSVLVELSAEVFRSGFWTGLCELTGRGSVAESCPSSVDNYSWSVLCLLRARIGGRLLAVGRRGTGGGGNLCVA